MPKDIRLWEITSGGKPTEITTNKLDLEGRLEEWIEEDISIISDEIVVIGRQVQIATGGVIDLLCIDVFGDLHIIELKRDRTPREVVAQVLDYGSWVKDFSNEEVTDIASDYLRVKHGISFEEAFRQKYGQELPDVINEKHSMLIVAAGLDSQTERIIEYLSDYYRVGINSLTFQYFKDESGLEFVGRVFLIDPKEVQQRAQSGPSSKRRTRLTMEEFKRIAVETGTEEMFEVATNELASFFDVIQMVDFRTFLTRST